MMTRSLWFVAALTLASAATATKATAQDALTLKERLSDKASDAQRVNNCRVAPERRGPVPRPDCPATAPPFPSVAGTRAPSQARSTATIGAH